MTSSMDVWGKLWEIAAGGEARIEVDAGDAGMVVLHFGDGSRAVLRWGDGRWSHESVHDSSPCDVAARDSL